MALAEAVESAEDSGSGGWHAGLSLAYECIDGRTRLSHRRHFGPLMVQRAFYPEPGVCHQYILHPPGGVVGGDTLEITVSVGCDARVLMTTPAAGKFYRAAGPIASQAQSLSVARGGVLEWLPQETILYESSNVRLTSDIHLAGDARFIGWEITCLGRPAAGVDYGAAKSRQATRIFRDGRLLMVENALLDGTSAMMDASWGLAGFSTVGSMWVTPADGEMLNKIRSLIDIFAKDRASVSRMPDGVLICRYLGREAAAAKQFFTEVWKAVRPQLAGCESCIPRVWLT